MAVTLVIGGAGRTGRLITRRLLGRGLPVRVLSRHAAASLSQGGAEYVPGDLADLDTDVLAGVTGVVVTVEPPADAAGADALLHRGVAGLAAAAASDRIPVVLVSQIYVSRPEVLPSLSGVIAARGRGEQALRSSGAPYAIVRPGWLTDGPGGDVRLEQGDTGDGTVSRETVAEACVQALLVSVARGRTFEVFDSDAGPGGAVDWPLLLGALAPDQGPS